MPSPRDLFDDPDFMGLPDAEKIKVISAIDTDFGGLPPEEQTRVFKLMGGGNSTSSIDAMLSTPRGQGPTVDDESVDVPSAPVEASDFTREERSGAQRANPLWALANPALGGLSPELARGQVKGLGQGVMNLARAAHQMIPTYGRGPGLLPPPEMPETLRTDDADTMGQIGAFSGRVAPSMAIPVGGVAGMAATGALGGAMNSGTPLGAALGAGGGAGLGVAAPYAQKAMAAVGRFGWPAVKGALERMPFLGPMGKGAIAGVRKELDKDVLKLGTDEARAYLEAVKAADEKAASIAQSRISAYGRADDEARAIADRAIAARRGVQDSRTAADMAAEELGAGKFVDAWDEVEGAIARRFPKGVVEPPTRAAASGSTPGEAFPPPPGMGAGSPVPLKPAPVKSPTSSTGTKTEFAPPPTGVTVRTGTTVPAKTAAKPEKLTPKSKAEEPPPDAKDDLLERLRGSIDKPSRGNVIREGRKGGKSRQDVGAALSDATNKPLDADDFREATSFLKEAGSLDDALRIIREAEGNSVQDVIRLSRAVREAARRGGK